MHIRQLLAPAMIASVLNLLFSFELCYLDRLNNFSTVSTNILLFSFELCLNGKVYCFGGDNGMEKLDTIEVYDSDTRRWTMLDVRLPEPMTAVRATTIFRGNKQLVLVVGG